MKNIKYLLVVLVSLLMLTSCSGRPKTVEDYSQKITDSLQNVSSATITETYVDQSIEVYKRERVITVTAKEDSGISGSIETRVTSLGSDFALGTTTTSTTFASANPETLFNYKMSEDCFESFPTMEKTELSGIVLQDKAAEFFNIEALSCSGNVSVTFNFGKKYQFDGFTITYKTTSNRDVTIVGTYSYEG